MIQPTRAQLNELADKWLKGKLTAQEKEILDKWYDYEHDQPLNWSGNNETEDEFSDRLLNQIQQSKNKSFPYKRRWQIPAAAILLISLGIGGYFYLNSLKQVADQETIAKNIKPGYNQATLTLANGKTILLTGARNGQLALQGTATIKKTADGKVVYKTDGSANAETNVAYNTMTTPNGGQYQLTLADGTKVWLNATSSIRYPTAFTGKIREVTITGEAYFEVTHNNEHPFRVIANGQVIEDLGTEFNVNAYDDEPVVKTTLIKGSVRVVKGSSNALLKPGQAAITKIQRGDIQVENVDTDEAAAWKNGQTLFNDEDIKMIMRQVARWYNVNIVYEGEIPTRHFEGGISRKSDLSSVLRILELNNIHFTVTNHTIVVKP
ncbi:MAG: anti-FecI sigma factor, FecR [Mucilaginibacter sp.]|nr:anti-FecI sigma factor, FecR [Mucilaginibacter sp.]